MDKSKFDSVGPGQAKRGAKPRDPSGQPRTKRSVYLTDIEYAAYLEWIEKRRLKESAK